MAAQESRVNLSLDVAWGKDGNASVYLYVGEAF